jgi:RHS repeat-associated protein
VEYTSFDLPRRLQGHNGLRLDFAYDAHHQRVLKQSASGERTVYMAGLYEKRLTSGGSSHVFHVQANGPVAQVTWRENGGSVSESTVYLHDDHLGSIETVTDASGQVLERRKYQPFGQRAEPGNPAQAAGAGMGGVRQGFTGHEEDTESGLLNMRGRMYDARVGRFLTADPFVQAPFFGQSHNRYSYAFNNPLSFVDPSGFTAEEVRTTAEGGSSSSVWDDIWGAVKRVARDIATDRTRAAPAQAEPLPGGPPPTPTADLNGSRDMGGVATGVGLALKELGSGLVKDMLRMNAFNPANRVGEAAFEMGKSILAGAKQGYAEDGVFGAVTGGINAVNPVYDLLTAGYTANVALDRGDRVSAGYYGTFATITAIGILATVAGGGAGAGRSGVATKGISASTTGNPAAIVRGMGELSATQRAVLAQLEGAGSRTIVGKRMFGNNDLAALTAATGDEFAMFTTGGRRLIVRGTAGSVPINMSIAEGLSAQGWRWTAHTHPGVSSNVLRSSLGDRAVLGAMGGSQSAILNSVGSRSLFSPAGDSLGGWLP